MKLSNLRIQKNHLLELTLVFIMTLVAYGYFSSSTDWNTNSRLGMVKAVVEEKRFEIDSYYNSKGLVTQDAAWFQGHFYSDKAIGSSLIGIAFYRVLYSIQYRVWGIPMRVRIFREVVSFLAISLICAFLAPLMYSFTKQISNSSRFALLVTVAICLGTPLYKYSTFYYGHVLTGLFLFIVFLLWFNIKNEEPINPPKLLITGYLLGYSIITEYPTAIIVLCLGLYILYVLWKRKRLFDLKAYLYLIIGASAPILLAMAYNYALFHDPFTTGYRHEAVAEFREGHESGFMGIGWPNLATLFYMTFHTTMGIFWQSPVLLLAFVGWFRMWKDGTYRTEAILSFGIVMVYFLIMSGYYIWWGGGAFTPRNIIPVLPFFSIPIVFLTKRSEKIMLLILALISISQMFIVTSAENIGLGDIVDNMSITSIYSMFQQPSTIYNVYLTNFLNQALEVNRGQEYFGLTGFQSLVPLLILEACIIAAFMKITSKKNQVDQLSVPQLSQQNPREA